MHHFTAIIQGSPLYVYEKIIDFGKCLVLWFARIEVKLAFFLQALRQVTNQYLKW